VVSDFDFPGFMDTIEHLEGAWCGDEAVDDVAEVLLPGHPEIHLTMRPTKATRAKEAKTMAPSMGLSQTALQKPRKRASKKVAMRPIMRVSIKLSIFLKFLTQEKSPSFPGRQVIFIATITRWRDGCHSGGAGAGVKKRA